MCEARVRSDGCASRVLLWRDVGVETAAFGGEGQLGAGTMMLMMLWVLLD